MNIHDKSRYAEVHARSLADPEGFWGEAARANYKSLAQELERLGAEMAIKNKPIAPLKSSPPLK